MKDKDCTACEIMEELLCIEDLLDDATATLLLEQERFLQSGAAPSATLRRRYCPLQSSRDIGIEVCLIALTFLGP